ncbi:hypothetical protein C1645_760964 [Glomus cerebriforme]|uniref:Uncharacterized protein n=1 Tax=Glomus cerebriforme TaxID=658196 RepID=A0A397T750_9GLOM|nr:hypothetical protein C1645_760964 [Glomus cerebriforme]
MYSEIFSSIMGRTENTVKYIYIYIFLRYVMPLVYYYFFLFFCTTRNRFETTSTC